MLRASAAGIGLWWACPSLLSAARAQGSSIRYSASSAEGKAMLRTYAAAVRTMMATSAANPLSWTFQWYSHWVRGDRTRQQELRRIFPSTTSPGRALAVSMWNSCQAHGGQNEDNFLPWHRMFVYYFEQLVRQVSGDNSFSLPYWDYTDPAQQAIPEEFRQPNDPVFGSLYRANRTSTPLGSVNAGDPITQAAGAGASALNLDSMLEPGYSGDTGFCAQLDGTLHGAVHVFTGNELGMAAVPWAANDPLFWLHHSNIDRIWAGWNAAGRQNPSNASWLATTFVFANVQGQAVNARISDFLDLTPLNYRYDRLPEIPATGVPAPAQVSGQRVATASGGSLRDQTFNAQLARGAVTTSAPRLSDVVGRRQVYLQITGLSASAQPGMFYNIFLALPAGATPSTTAPNYVGALAFFDAVGHEGHTMTKTRMFNVTRQLSELRARGQLTENPKITLIPTGEPAPNSNPIIGEISLVVR
jgi:hypothetical protein